MIVPPYLRVFLCYVAMIVRVNSRAIFFLGGRYPDFAGMKILLTFALTKIKSIDTEEDYLRC